MRLGFAWNDPRAWRDASSRQRARRDVRRQAPPLHAHLVSRVGTQTGVLLAATGGGYDCFSFISWRSTRVRPGEHGARGCRT